MHTQWGLRTVFFVEAIDLRGSRIINSKYCARRVLCNSCDSSPRRHALPWRSACHSTAAVAATATSTSSSLASSLSELVLESFDTLLGVQALNLQLLNLRVKLGVESLNLLPSLAFSLRVTIAAGHR